MNEDKSFRLLTALAGVIGVILVASFRINPGPPAGASLTTILDYGRQHATSIALGGWMQGMGSVFNILFAVGLMELTGCTRKLSGWVTLLSGAGILATSLAESGLYFAALEAGRTGDTSTLVTTLTLIKGVQHVYLIVPALLLPLAWAILRSRILPAALGWSGLAIGAALQILGVAGVFDTLQPVVDTLLIVQGLWFLAASLALGIPALRMAAVAPSRRPSAAMVG